MLCDTIPVGKADRGIVQVAHNASISDFSTLRANKFLLIVYLQSILSNISSVKQCCFFYLDSHETQILFAH